jgi:hypothetical protein
MRIGSPVGICHSQYVSQTTQAEKGAGLDAQRIVAALETQVPVGAGRQNYPIGVSPPFPFADLPPSTRPTAP